MGLITGVLIVAYGLCFLLIAIYCLNQLFIFKQYFRKSIPEQTPDHPVEWPMVTLQLPIYNEPLVIERLLRSAIQIDYPSDKLEIQILDDSDDDTGLKIVRFLDKYAHEIPFEVHHICREVRTGFKAGALQHGMERCKGKFIAIFDADFIIQPDFLKKTIPWFSMEDTGVVQTRWDFINADYSLLTRLQAWQLHLHFTVEQVARANSAYLLQFNGTGGVWRKQTILDAGGWSHDTITEDLDLSYRAQLNGWKIKYLESVTSPSELPVHIAALKAQQFRWTKGGAECAVKLLPMVFKSNLSHAQKFQAVMHLGASTMYALLFFGAVFSCMMLPLIAYSSVRLDFFAFFLAGLLALIPVYFYGFKRFIHSGQKPAWLSFIPGFIVFLAMSLGLSLQNTSAVMQAWYGRKTPFIRTPKWGFELASNTGFKNIHFWRMKDNAIKEGLLGSFFILALGMGIYLGAYHFVLFHFLLGSGLMAIFVYANFFNPK